MITVDGTGCVGEKIWQNGTLEDPDLFDLNCKGIYNVWRDVPEEAVATVEDYTCENGYVYYAAESSKLYYPEMALTRNCRHVVYSEMGYFIILDELKSKQAHKYTWRLHGESFAEPVEEDVFYQIKNGKGTLNVYTVHPENKECRVEETIINEIMTPQRPDDIREIKLKTLCVENGDHQNDLNILNVLQPISSFSQDNLEIKAISEGSCTGVEVKKGEVTELFLYSEDGAINFEGLRSDAQWVSIVWDKDQIVKHMNYKGTYLKLDNREL